MYLDNIDIMFTFHYKLSNNERRSGSVGKYAHPESDFEGAKGQGPLAFTSRNSYLV